MAPDEFRLAPEAASTLAGDYDLLFYTMLALSILVIGGVVLTGIYFGAKYRRGSPASREQAPPERRRVLHRRIEYAWTLIPLGLFIGIFLWGAVLYSRELSPPPGAMEIDVVAKQWMWKLQHPGGQREIDALHVPVGVPVKLVMTSQDVIHSFYVPAFRIKQDVVPGRYLTTWFTATETGEFRFLCAEYCGAHHSHMRGRLIVMEPADFERWLDGQIVPASMAARGEQLFRHYGCSGCHDPNSAIHAPQLQGLYGRPVQLEGGGTVIADERYIHDSIVQPRKQVVAGFRPIMPSFEGQISEDEIMQLIAYLKTLGAQDGGTP